MRGFPFDRLRVAFAGPRGTVAKSVFLRTFLAVALWVIAAASAHATAACPAVAPRPEAERKFHPGHYVAIGRNELRSGVNLNAVLGEGVTGVQLRYRWAELEPEQGRYNFAALRKDLEAASRSGLQLVAVIEDKSFNGEMPTPRYLQGRETMRGRRGYTALRWDPYVIERMSQLVAEIGLQFDCHPNLEGIAFQETALSVDEPTLHASGYSPERYRDALQTLLRSAARSLPRSRVFWYMNFLPGQQQYLGDVAESVVGTGVVMGGPDILPDNDALARRTYPFYERFSRRMKLFGSMQHDSYRHPRRGSLNGDYWSMEDLFLFARDQLHVDYVFWEYRSRRQPENSRDWTEAREVIARHPSFRRAG